MKVRRVGGGDLAGLEGAEDIVADSSVERSDRAVFGFNQHGCLLS